MEQTEQIAAAAAVAAIYFVCLLGTALNLKLTGFKLYMPLSIAALARTLSFATRAAYFATGNIQLFAVNRATGAIGLGIGIAMCSCFLIIWLRNAQPVYQPPAATRAVPVLCKLLVGGVILMGPILGVTAAGLSGAQPGIREHGLEAKKASVAGFLVFISLLTLLTAFVSINWLKGVSASNSQQQDKQQQQQPSDLPTCTCIVHQLKGDGLILLLLLCDVLLLWSAAAALASVYHPELASSVQLHYPIMVLPELLVAVLFASPTVAARIALGGRYSEWRHEQVAQRQLRQQQKAEGGLSKAFGEYDAEANADGDLELAKGRM